MIYFKVEDISLNLYHVKSKRIKFFTYDFESRSFFIKSVSTFDRKKCSVREMKDCGKRGFYNFQNRKRLIGNRESVSF